MKCAKNGAQLSISTENYLDALVFTVFISKLSDLDVSRTKILNSDITSSSVAGISAFISSCSYLYFKHIEIVDLLC